MHAGRRRGEGGAGSSEGEIRIDANRTADIQCTGARRSAGRLGRYDEGRRWRGRLAHKQVIGSRGGCAAVIALDRVPDLIERPLIGVGKLRIAWKIKTILHIWRLRLPIRRVDDVKSG